jgi:hypothetical protein
LNEILTVITAAIITNYFRSLSKYVKKRIPNLKKNALSYFIAYCSNILKKSILEGKKRSLLAKGFFTGRKSC